MISLLRLLPLFAVFIDAGSLGARVSSVQRAPASVAQGRGRVATDSMLLTTAQLRERLTRGNVVLLHVGERADYDAAHIPGARFFPYDAISAQRSGGLMLEIPPTA